MEDLGRWVDELIVDYFEGIFASNGIDDAAVLNLIQGRVTEEQNMKLCKPYTINEVKATVFFMHPNKSLVPDGMNPDFFQHFWQIVGMDVANACLHMLQTCSLSQGLNDTCIVLLPKKNPPHKMTGNEANFSL